MKKIFQTLDIPLLWCMIAGVVVGLVTTGVAGILTFTACMFATLLESLDWHYSK